MGTTTGYRLISADDHVDLAHDQVKAHLATKHHAEYDAAYAHGLGLDRAEAIDQVRRR